MPTVTVIQPKAADNEKRLLRIAAYCRVSSNSEDQLNSYNSQLTYYSHKFENSETETLIDIYADEGITGTCEEKRTEFLRLIDDCRKGKIDRVYTKSISRFARNTRDCLKNIRELKSLGVTIMFEKENIDTANINDELMITIMGGLAQEESVSISQNMKWSIRRKMKKGKYTPHIAPFGYRLKDNTFVIIEEEAEIVRDIYTTFVNGNGTQRTADLIFQKYGAKLNISYSTIRYILKNEKYIGDSLFQKFFTPDTIGARCKENKGEKEMYYVSNTHPAIISKELYETAQKLMENRCIARKSPISSPFKRKILCKSCGSIYQHKISQKTSYWVCKKHDDKSSLCNSKPISEIIIVSAFIKVYNSLLSNVEYIIKPVYDSLQELEIKQAKGNKKIIDLRRNILQLKEQLKVVATLRTKGFLNEAKFKEQSLEINNKIDKLSKDIRLLSQTEDTTLKDIEMLIDYFEKREHIMIEFEPQAFEILIDKIVVKENILEFHIMGGLIFTEEI